MLLPHPASNKLLLLQCWRPILLLPKCLPPTKPAHFRPICFTSELLEQLQHSARTMLGRHPRMWHSVHNLPPIQPLNMRLRKLSNRLHAIDRQRNLLEQSTMRQVLLPNKRRFVHPTDLPITFAARRLHTLPASIWRGVLALPRLLQFRPDALPRLPQWRSSAKRRPEQELLLLVLFR